MQGDAHGPGVAEPEAGLADPGQGRLGGGVGLIQGQPAFRVEQALAVETQPAQQRRRIMAQLGEHIAQQHHIDPGNPGGEPGPARNHHRLALHNKTGKA